MRSRHRDTKPSKSSPIPALVLVCVLGLGAVVFFVAQSRPVADEDDEALVERCARERIEPWFQQMRRARVEITAEQLHDAVERAKPFVRDDLRRARLEGRRTAEIHAEFGAKLDEGR